MNELPEPEGEEEKIIHAKMKFGLEQLKEIINKMESQLDHPDLEIRKNARWYSWNIIDAVNNVFQQVSDYRETLKND